MSAAVNPEKGPAGPGNGGKGEETPLLLAAAEVDAGICGFKTLVGATGKTGRGKEMVVEIRIVSECPSWRKAAAEVTSLGPYRELFSPLPETELYGIVSRHVRHPACPVTAGVFKVLEVAAGLALPKDACIKVGGERLEEDFFRLKGIF
ncbi:MAG: DUF6951 family protein [Desulfotomaculales bacterium]